VRHLGVVIGGEGVGLGMGSGTKQLTLS
jgi:hypothetical protein